MVPPILIELKKELWQVLETATACEEVAYSNYRLDSKL